MDFFDEARGMFEAGSSAIKGAVSGVAIENHAFMRGFVRLCSDGFAQGWHERNGGNVSYRLTEREVEQCRAFFASEPGDWQPLGLQVANMGGAFFAVTATGSYLRNVELDVERNVGIVQIGADGSAYRVVWGLKEGGRPTSELPSHVMIHGVRSEATGGASRVLYHAHPSNVIALTKVLPLDDRTFTRALWKAMTECVIAIPTGIGVVPWMVPGSIEIAQATAELMKTYEATIWAQHGLFASGVDFDSTFGLVHTVEKSAGIYAQARLLAGGSDAFLNTISDDDLRAIAKRYSLPINEAFLD